MQTIAVHNLLPVFVLWVFILSLPFLSDFPLSRFVNSSWGFEGILKAWTGFSVDRGFFSKKHNGCELYTKKTSKLCRSATSRQRKTCGDSTELHFPDRKSESTQELSLHAVWNTKDSRYTLNAQLYVWNVFAIFILKIQDNFDFTPQHVFGFLQKKIYFPTSS